MVSASHRLHSDQLSAEENRRVYGKCNNPHGHGHNYVIEVLVAGPVVAETGMVVDMASLDGIVRETVLSRFDHANLNLDALFVNRVPTTENLCREIFRLLEGRMPAGRLHMVRVEETENNSFECRRAEKE
jgi:6-pyruvoyltetrahydropterin/6-carboxytetrahydropterin synthase